MKFPVEQPVLSREFLPALSVPQQAALATITEAGGVYEQCADGYWLPLDWQALSGPARANFSVTARMVTSLVRSQYLTEFAAGEALRVQLTFP
jgi:hypothetical protein